MMWRSDLGEVKRSFRMPEFQGLNRYTVWRQILLHGLQKRSVLYHSESLYFIKEATERHMSRRSETEK